MSGWTPSSPRRADSPRRPTFRIPTPSRRAGRRHRTHARAGGHPGVQRGLHDHGAIRRPRDDDWWKIIDTNLSGTVYLVQAVLAGMQRRGGGNIVIIASEWGVIGWPNAGAYAASKAGLIALTKSLGRELAPEQHHRQRDRAGNHRHPTASGRRRRRRYHSRRDARAVRARNSARAHRQTGRYRGGGLAVGPRGHGCVRRPDRPDQWRDDTMPDMTEHNEPVQPVDGTVVPRYAGFSTFARLPRIDDVPTYDVAVVGIPFDTGCQLPAGRPVRARPRSAVLPGAAAVPSADAGVAVRHPAGGRRRRYRLHPLRHRQSGRVRSRSRRAR